MRRRIVDIAFSAIMEGRTKHVRVGGKLLETLQIASTVKSRPTIVMLHEGLGSVSLWKDFPRQLAQRTGCGVIAYSRHGYGRSDRLQKPRSVEYMHYEGEVVLPELLDRLGVERPVLLGHSDGGSIALIYAGRHPEHVHGLILEAPHVFVEDISVASISEAKTVFRTTDLREKLARHHDDPDGAFYGWNDVWLDPRFRSWNIEEYLATIRCPVLVIQGENDEYGTIAQVDAIRAAVAGTETLILPRCGHSPHRDQPEATLEASAAFIERLAASIRR